MSKKSKMDAIKAYHEAGHAVVARALGVDVAYVSVLEVDGVSMHESAEWRVRGSDPSTQALACEKDAQVMLAGLHAQCKYRPVRHVKREREAWANDLARAQLKAARIVLYRAGGETERRPTPFRADTTADATANRRYQGPFRPIVGGLSRVGRSKLACNRARR